MCFLGNSFGIKLMDFKTVFESCIIHSVWMYELEARLESTMHTYMTCIVLEATWGNIYICWKQHWNSNNDKNQRKITNWHKSSQIFGYCLFWGVNLNNLVIGNSINWETSYSEPQMYLLETALGNIMHYLLEALENLRFLFLYHPLAAPRQTLSMVGGGGGGGDRERERERGRQAGRQKRLSAHTVGK